MSQNKDYKLCLVKENFAYFTDKELSDQWGDDWNDVPYQDNAGPPYSDYPENILKVAFEADVQTAECLPIQYSVQRINEGDIPWINSSNYSMYGEKIYIYAGEKLDDFIKKIFSIKGIVYIPIFSDDYGVYTSMISFEKNIFKKNKKETKVSKIANLF